jgi:hypothetical protein
MNCVGGHRIRRPAVVRGAHSARERRQAGRRKDVGAGGRWVAVPQHLGDYGLACPFVEQLCRPTAAEAVRAHTRHRDPGGVERRLN